MLSGGSQRASVARAHPCSLGESNTQAQPTHCILLELHCLSEHACPTSAVPARAACAPRTRALATAR
eukprot:4019979-Alexandrium_andersonii.AAC.1